MTALRDILLDQIAATGPLRVSDYMASCLLHPVHGYYTTGRPFGSEGDFVTAPEISQMFGELIGLALAQAWLDQGAPSPVTLAELGPGRGTLMADVLRATTGVPGFAEAARVTLFDASPQLRAVQADTLKGHDPCWIDNLDDLPPQPLLVIANEFFDALPIRQFQRAGDMWRERKVGARNRALTFGLGPAQPQPALADRLNDTRDGDLVEDCPSLAPTMAPIVDRIARHGGAALIVDYGDWRSLGDTLQAVQGHINADPLDAPGKADLSAHVDFEALSRSAAPCKVGRLTPQGVFLERLGITQRAQNLARSLRGKTLDNHIAAHRRLTHPQEMGNLFKVMAIVPQTAPMLPGVQE